MTETLGGLIDRLSIVNMKLWFVQEKVNDAAADHRGLDAHIVQQLRDLNLQRNKLMAEIDRTIDRAIKEGGAEIDPRVKITK